MGHISQAWTNLAPPSANFLTECATESLRACGDGGIHFSCAATDCPQQMPNGQIA
jgi:hypothetical protein